VLKLFSSDCVINILERMKEKIMGNKVEMGKVLDYIINYMDNYEVL
jgi:hypothetical protein